MMTVPGRAEIDSFHLGASDGVFTMEAATARQCVDAVDQLIRGLEAQIGDARFMRLEIGDTFDSAQQMLAGFASKAASFENLLVEYVAAAQRLKASFEIAGALVADAEADNASGLLRAEGGSR